MRDRRPLAARLFTVILPAASRLGVRASDGYFLELRSTQQTVRRLPRFVRSRSLTRAASETHVRPSPLI